jgi:hypothetical protein
VTTNISIFSGIVMDTDAVIYRSTDEKSKPKRPLLILYILNGRSIEKLNHF